MLKLFSERELHRCGGMPDKLCAPKGVGFKSLPLRIGVFIAEIRDTEDLTLCDNCAIL